MHGLSMIDSLIIIDEFNQVVGYLLVNNTAIVMFRDNKVDFK